MAVLVEVARQRHYSCRLNKHIKATSDIEEQSTNTSGMAFRLGSLVTLARCLGNARVLSFSVCAVKVACSLA